MKFPAVAQSGRDAAVAAQYVLNLMNPAQPVKVDGVVGRETRAAFARLDTDARESVSTFVASRNPTVAKAMVSAPSSPDEPGRYISREEAYRLIDVAIKKYGEIPGLSGVSTRDFMRWKLDLEAARKGDLYDTRSGAGTSYLGLYQHGREAWADVQEKGPRESGLSSVPYQTGAFNAVFSTEAGLIYSQLTAGYLRNYGYRGPLTKEVLYAAYNQGANGFYRLGSPWRDVQSRVARPVIDLAAKHAGVKITSAQIG